MILNLSCFVRKYCYSVTGSYCMIGSCCMYLFQIHALCFSDPFALICHQKTSYQFQDHIIRSTLLSRYISCMITIIFDFIFSSLPSSNLNIPFIQNLDTLFHHNLMFDFYNMQKRIDD